MSKSLPNKKRRVHFDPDNVDIIAEEGDNLLQTAIAAGVHINASCGGNGACGTCKVLIKEGGVDSTRTEKLSEEEYNQGLRQACQSSITTDLVVYIPVESRLETAILDRERKELATGAERVETVATGWTFTPPLNKLFIALPPPTLDDNTSDLSRLLRGLRKQYKLNNISVDFSVLKKLSQVLRDGHWKVTVTTLLNGSETRWDIKRRPTIINVEPGDTRGKHYSIIFDIGTTAVRGQLLDLNRGTVLARGIEYNGQISYGEDIITRIAYCQKPGGLQKLQQVVVATINGIIKQLLAEAGVKVEHVGHIVATGNTTMIQLLLGLKPKYIRLAPYTPTANFIPQVRADSIGIEVGEHVYLHAPPSVSSYVGADIVSGILGAGVYQRKKLTLYIDIGTNGEIVIGNSDWMVTASCSAGPAFAGGEIKHGIIATDGAIEDFDINPTNFEPVVSTIGEVKPKGICGAGLISIVAGLLEVGIIGPNGKFNSDLRTERVRQGSDGYEYVICWSSETQTGEDIVITEVDIENLIRAKAAMYAGCQTLIRSVALTPSSLEQIIIAGAFGVNIDIAKAITIGLFPDLPLKKFVFIGNGSLLGARLASFSTDMLNDEKKVARMMTNFELSEDATFMNNYIAALFLPHTNASEFPSVKKKLATARRLNSSRE